MRRPRADKGASTVYCVLCERVGLVKAFRNMASLKDHVEMHTRREVLFDCPRCGNVPVSEDGVVHSCEPAERARRRVRVQIEDDDGGDLVPGGDHDDLCPRCGCVLSGSQNRRIVHISSCDGGSQNELNEAVLNDGDLLLEADQEFNMMEHDEDNAIMHMHVAPSDRAEQVRLQNNGKLITPLPPTWSCQPFVQTQPNFNVHAGFEADMMLLNALRVNGQFVSDSTMTRLYAVLASKEFQDSMKRGGLSKNFHTVKIREQKAEMHWTKVSLRDGQTIVNVRDLLDVLLEMNSDPALMDAMDFKGKWPDPDESGLIWGAQWTQFPVFQARLQELKDMGRENLVDNISWMMWADGGETSHGRGRRQSSLDLLCMVPLNVPPSMARRKDCLYPIAFFESVGENAMTDVIEYFLPQLVALRDHPRLLPGRSRHVRVTLDGIVGDNPAVTEICGTMMSAGGTLPCKLCWLRQEQNAQKQWQGLNDPSRWLAVGGCILRTQAAAEKEILRMRSNPNYKQQQSGFRDEFKNRDVPLFAYFDSRSPGLDMFSCLMFDRLHDIYLGLLKECFRAMAQEVIAQKKETDFLSYCAMLSTARLRGLDATLMREKDFSRTTNTTVLHLLAGGHGSLMGREMQALAPVLLFVFDACSIETLSKAIEPLTRIVNYCTALESRSWPLNAPDVWWEGLRRFAIDAYADFRQVMNRYLGKERRFVKIHTALVHALEVRRRHCVAGDVQALEGQFGTMKGIPTNKKDVGIQLVKKLEAIRTAGNWIAGLSPAAQVVAKIVDSAVEERKSRINCAADLPEAVIEEGTAFCAAKGWTIVRWAKWVALPIEQTVAMADRGERMMYAAKSWYGREKYDVLQLDEEYFALRGLCVATDPQAAKEHIVGVGLNLLRHYRSDDQQRVVSFRMPILRLVVGEALSCRDVVLDEVHVVSLIPHLRPVDRPFQQQLVRESGIAYHEGDKVFHHNIFITRGSMRYHNESLWFPVNNNEHL